MKLPGSLLLLAASVSPRAFITYAADSSAFFCTALRYAFASSRSARSPGSFKRRDSTGSSAAMRGIDS